VEQSHAAVRVSIYKKGCTKVYGPGAYDQSRESSVFHFVQGLCRSYLHLRHIALKQILFIPISSRKAEKGAKKHSNTIDSSTVALCILFCQAAVPTSCEPYQVFEAGSPDKALTELADY